MPHDISAKLKTLRVKRGLTLDAASRLTGTSPAALHRYENGWERFDIRTLEKIAQGLGGELRVDFKLKRGPRKPRSLREIYGALKPLFWDSPVPRARMKEHADWLTLRVLEFGNLDQVQALLALFTITEIRDSFLRQLGKFSRKTQSAWIGYFNLKDPPCTPKSLPKEPVPFMNV